MMKHFLFFTAFVFIAINNVLCQNILPEGVRHLKVKRLNDSFIDVYIQNAAINKKIPLLIFLQGSGHDSNTEGFLELSKQFGTRVASMVIEKQGIKYGGKGSPISEVYKSNNTIYNRLYDYLRVLQYLRANAPWWNGEVFAIGYSEGGLLGGMLASFYPDTKGVAILCYGGGLTFGEVWPLSCGLQKRAEGATAEQIGNEGMLVRDSLEYIRKNPTFLKSYRGKDKTYAWWSSIMDLRLLNAIVDLDIPIFVGNGTEDLVAPTASAQKLNEAFIRQKKANLHYKEYIGLDHCFNDAAGDSHMLDVYTEAINWMLRKNGEIKLN